MFKSYFHFSYSFSYSALIEYIWLVRLSKIARYAFKKCLEKMRTFLLPDWYFSYSNFVIDTKESAANILFYHFNFVFYFRSYKSHFHIKLLNDHRFKIKFLSIRHDSTCLFPSHNIKTNWGRVYIYF